MKTLLLSLLVFTSASAYALNQTPVLHDLRLQFEKGVSPSSDDLLNKTFQCQLRFILEGDFSVWTSTAMFSLQDGVLVLNDSEPQLKFTDNGKEIIGEGEDGYIAYRMNQEGSLIGELSSEDKESSPLEPIANVGLNTTVIGYEICISK